MVRRIQTVRRIQFRRGGKSMRALIQRVKYGRVSVAGQLLAEIGPGLVILLGVGMEDAAGGAGEEKARYLVEKIANLRIFEDKQGKMNLSLRDVGGEALVISQFTLYADTRKGRRPSFTDAASAEIASPLVDRFAELLANLGIPTKQGKFAAHMLVEIANDGPVTLWMESPLAS
jgi:D-tyrosyl-tRNA(Tyr) deacylase